MWIVVELNIYMFRKNYKGNRKNGEVYFCDLEIRKDFWNKIFNVEI